jgi:glycosyltransferase involved in cell wall biosynthesis
VTTDSAALCSSLKSSLDDVSGAVQGVVGHGASATRPSRVVGGMARLALRALMHGYLVALRLCTRQGSYTREPADEGYTILLTGTFHAESWARAHICPLAASQHCSRVLVASTYPLSPLDKVEVICPPHWLIRLAGAVGARLLTFAWIAVRRRPHVIGGFHLLFNGMAAALLARLVGAKSLYFCVGGPAEILGGGVAAENRLFAHLPGPDAILEQHLLQVVDAFDVVVTMGTRAVRYFRERGVGKAFGVVPGGFHIDEFRPTAAPRPVDLVFVGRLAPIKRVDLLLQAVACVRRTLPDVRVEILGDGTLREPLEQQVQHLGLESNVRFVGAQPKVTPWLTRARVFVLTSDSEGLALALIEAMLCGLPVVCSNVGDLPDLVEDGVNGYLVTARTPERFAERIVSLLTDPERLVAFGRAGRAAAERFDIGRVAHQWDTILSSPALNGRTTRGPAAAMPEDLRW